MTLIERFNRTRLKAFTRYNASLFEPLKYLLVEQYSVIYKYLMYTIPNDTLRKNYFTKIMLVVRLFK